MLVVRIGALTASPEPKRHGDAGQHRCRKRSAQSVENADLADIRLQVRHEIGNRCDPGADSLHATAEPADCPRQCYLWPADQIGGGFQAAGRLHRRDTYLDRVKQARQPRGQKIGEQAECPMTLGAVPARNTEPGRRHPRITTVTDQRATALRV